MGYYLNSSNVFDSLKIASAEKYWEHLNQHNVVYIDFSEAANDCGQWKKRWMNLEKKYGFAYTNFCVIRKLFAR